MAYHGHSFDDQSTNHDVLKSLSSTIDHCSSSLFQFFNHDFAGAKEMVLPYVDRSYYHAHGYSMLLAIEAVLTFDPQSFADALEANKHASQMANMARRKPSFIETLGRMIGKYNHEQYTEQEIHAEMCYAESQLLLGCLTMINEESVIGLLRAGFKFRSGYESYRECFSLFKSRKWKDSVEDQNFVSAICLGVGIFHCIVSVLPRKFLSLMEFVGFTENRKGGLEYLERGSLLETTMHGPMCSLFLCTFHMFLTQMLGFSDGDLQQAEKAVFLFGKSFPESGFYTLMEGRLQVLKGHFVESKVLLEKSIGKCSTGWRRFGHVGMWELMWINFYMGHFREASQTAAILYKESPWSTAMFSYLKCAFLCAGNEKLSDEEKKEINELISNVPKHIKKFAGKSIPIERIAESKSKRYLVDGNLRLRALEVCFLFNGLSQIVKDKECSKTQLSFIETSIREIEAGKSCNKYYFDDMGLALLLKGVLLKHLNAPFPAETCFKRVCENEHKLLEDMYLVPYSMLELGLLYAEAGKYDAAKLIVETARTAYSGYVMETRLQLKIQVVLRNLSSNCDYIMPPRCDDVNNGVTPMVEMPALSDDDDEATRVELAEDPMQNL